MHLHLHVAWWQWGGTLGLIVALLLADLLLLQRRPHAPVLREALLESAGWIAVSLAFGLVVWSWFGSAAAGQYYAGYLLEKSLSVDNVFVWGLVLGRFAVPAAYRARVLFWGVFGALTLRALCIAVGVGVLARFEAVLYVFGAFLIYTAVRILLGRDTDEDPTQGRVARFLQRSVPHTPDYDGARIFTRVDGRRLATPLLTVIVIVEITDLLFATDSIPAVLAVSRNTFIAFSSNAFAVCGLRALYSCLEGARCFVHRLDEAVAVILAFVGAKMLLVHVWEISTAVSLVVIVVVLTSGVLWSLVDARE